MSSDRLELEGPPDPNFPMPTQSRAIPRPRITKKNSARHILQQLQDRSTDSTWVDLSMQCSRMLRSACLLMFLSDLVSLQLLRADGIDQAKFRVPRQNLKTHALDSLIRPALHVQGCWAHGFGFHFAVADEDQKKDTTTNVEVIARMLESIFLKHGALARSLVLLMDNCPRECKNQKILKVVAKWVILKIHKHVWLAYPEKGHSHGPLDAVYGQATVKLGNCEFDDDEDVVALLQGFLDDGSLEHGTDDNAKAYKLDQAATWVAWAENDLKFFLTKHTGHDAPQSFHICLRRDLIRTTELPAEPTAWPGAPPPHGDDLVVALRANMSDSKAYQVALLVPHLQVEWLRLHAEGQPKGIHPRRPFSFHDREKVVRQVHDCYLKGALSKKTLDYLTTWCQGTLRQQKRPKEYCFLRHRVTETPGVECQLAPSAARYLDPKWSRQPRHIQVSDKKSADVEPEPIEDDGDAPLRIVNDER